MIFGIPSAHTGRMDARDAQPVSQLTGPIQLPTDPRAIAMCVHHGGRCFRITFDQATVFVRRVHRLIDHGGSELIPLLHETGVDLLLVSGQTPLQIHDIRDHSLDRSHPKIAND